MSNILILYTKCSDHKLIYGWILYQYERKLNHENQDKFDYVMRLLPTDHD